MFSPSALSLYPFVRDPALSVGRERDLTSRRHRESRRRRSPPPHTHQLLTCRIVRPVSCANCFFWSSEGYGCCKDKREGERLALAPQNIRGREWQIGPHRLLRNRQGRAGKINSQVSLSLPGHLILESASERAGKRRGGNGTLNPAPRKKGRKEGGRVRIARGALNLLAKLD